MGPRPAASASPGDILEIQILGSCTRCNESQTPEVRSNSLWLDKLSFRVPFTFTSPLRVVILNPRKACGALENPEPGTFFRLAIVYLWGEGKGGAPVIVKAPRVTLMCSQG